MRALLSGRAGSRVKGSVGRQVEPRGTQVEQYLDCGPQVGRYKNCVEKVYDKYTRTLWNGLRKEFIYGIHGKLILKINCIFIDMVDKSTS